MIYIEREWTTPAKLWRVTYAEFDGRPSRCLSQIIVAVECGDRLGNNLKLPERSRQGFWSKMPVRLNEEKDIVSWTVDETDVGLRVPPFSADEERDDPSSASDSGVSHSGVASAARRRSQ
jgi:hypothetical protein